MADETLRLLQETMDRAVECGEMAGVNLLVLQHGRERWYAQSGSRNVARGEAMERDTILRLYSQTKPITGVAAMMLVERGLIDLGEPVSDFLPGFVGQRVVVSDGERMVSDIPTDTADNGWVLPGDGERTVPVERDVTIKDLLTMTAGTSYPEVGSEAGRLAGQLFDEIQSRLHTDRPMDTQEVANRIGQLPLAFQPGAHFKYGTCADVIGAVIEIASGRRFADFLREELFEPLGMHDTGFAVAEEDMARLAAVYDNPSNPMRDLTRADVPEERWPELVTDHLGVPYAASETPAFQSGGAGLRSTLDDYGKFARMLLRGGELNGTRILRPTTVEMMTSNGLFDHQILDYRDWLPGHGYNAFMRVLDEPGKANFIGRCGEYGWDGWLGTYFSNDPSTDSTFLMGMQLTNAGTTPLVRRLKNIVNPRL